MNNRGTCSVGLGHEEGRELGGKVWRGKEVNRRRTGDGIGSQGLVMATCARCASSRKSLTIETWFMMQMPVKKPSKEKCDFPSQLGRNLNFRN